METAKRQILAMATLDFGSIAANTTAELTVVVNGVDTADVNSGPLAIVSAASLESGLMASAYVSAVNEVTVRVANVTIGAVDPASQDFYIAVVY